jgi:hypothetical protein
LTNYQGIRKGAFLESGFCRNLGMVERYLFSWINLVLSSFPIPLNLSELNSLCPPFPSHKFDLTNYQRTRKGAFNEVVYLRLDIPRQKLGM